MARDKRGRTKGGAPQKGGVISPLSRAEKKVAPKRGEETFALLRTTGEHKRDTRWATTKIYKQPGKKFPPKPEFEGGPIEQKGGKKGTLLERPPIFKKEILER